MKTFLQILIFTLTCSFSFSQESNFIATYKIKYIPINFDSISKLSGKKEKKSTYKKGMIDTRKMLKVGGENLKKLRFSLEFNKKQSIFYKQPVLNDVAQKMRLITLIFDILDQKYFVNSKKNIIQKNSYGQDFLVEMPKIAWEISSEQKKIGNYTCYKATAQIKKENDIKKFNVNIVAWFAPEIPFNYGPKYYAGLPGLIVELKEGKNIIYQLVKIKQKKYKKIDIPEKGKKISQKDFEKLSKKMFESLRSSKQ